LDPARLVFNGIDAATGEYLYAPSTLDEFATTILDGAEVGARFHVSELAERNARAEPTFGVAYGVDPEKLDQAGWGFVAAADAPAEVLEALEPLTTLRRCQAADRFRSFTGEAGLRCGETKDEWLSRHGMGPGDAEPEKVPYYLLLVGGPGDIPYRFQYELDVNYAVGRIAFDTPNEYQRYGEAVVSAEASSPQAASSLAIFAPENADDRATALSANELARPLCAELPTKSYSDCSVEHALAGAATKQQLASFMWGPEAADVLFTASHGVGFPPGHDQQRLLQGALLCQDWPGPRAWHNKPLEHNFYLAGSDIPDSVDTLPRIVFAFACFGAGTPLDDDFGYLKWRRPRKLAPQPFIARLPQMMLGHPARRTLAFVGHIERAWEYSFSTPKAGRQIGAFVSTLASIVDGRRVGYALEYFNARYASVGSDLANLLEIYARKHKRPPRHELAAKLIAANDARNYALLGDPAVRLSAP
jgi:hypothetical protein